MLQRFFVMLLSALSAFCGFISLAKGLSIWALGENVGPVWEKSSRALVVGDNRLGNSPGLVEWVWAALPHGPVPAVLSGGFLLTLAWIIYRLGKPARG